MNTKVINGLYQGYKIIVGCAAGYMTYKLLDKPTNKLIEESDNSILNAAVIGMGQGAVSSAVGIVVAAIM